MPKTLKTEVLQIPLTKLQMEKIKKKAGNEILSPAAYTRQHLIKTLKLKEK